MFLHESGDTCTCGSRSDPVKGTLVQNSLYVVGDARHRYTEIVADRTFEEIGSPLDDDGLHESELPRLYQRTVALDRKGKLLPDSARCTMEEHQAASGGNRLRIPHTGASVWSSSRLVDEAERLNCRQ